MDALYCSRMKDARSPLFASALASRDISESAGKRFRIYIVRYGAVHVQYSYEYEFFFCNDKYEYC